MTARKRFSDSLAKMPLIAILRGLTPETAESIAEVLTEEAITLLEVPLNSPDAIRSIGLLANKYRDTDVCLGAGTVLTVEQVNRVADAGGQYIISPNTNPRVIEETRRRGLIAIPGFLTPTEAFTAVDAGADYLKCFPVRALGVPYLKDLKAVLSPPLIAVGGVDLNSLGGYLGVAAAVGIGSNLYRPDKSLADLRQECRAYSHCIYEYQRERRS